MARLQKRGSLQDRLSSLLEGRGNIQHVVPAASEAMDTFGKNLANEPVVLMSSIVLDS